MSYGAGDKPAYINAVKNSEKYHEAPAKGTCPKETEEEAKDAPTRAGARYGPA